jgi:hypothetical protein
MNMENMAIPMTILNVIVIHEMKVELLGLVGCQTLA